MDPESGGLEAILGSVRDLASSTALSASEVGEGLRRVIAAYGFSTDDARSAGLGVTSFGHSMGKTALEAEIRNAQLVKQLLDTGLISHAAARAQLGLGEEDEVRRHLGLGHREEIPAEAAPIAGYLRVHRDPQTLRTVIRHRDGTELLRIDEGRDKRSIGQIILEELVPRVCSGCGTLDQTSLCPSCRSEAIADLGDVLRGE